MFRRILPVLAVSLSLPFCSCGKYITYFTSPVELNPSQDKVVVVCTNENLRHALENSLINKGLFVKSMETEYMFKSEMEDQVGIEKYTYMQGLTGAIHRGGKVKGVDKIFDNIKDWNNLKDELIRVDDYSKLVIKKADVLKKIYEVFGVDYIVSVQSQSKSNYAVRMISVKDNRLVFTMYLNSDKNGIDKIFPSVDSIPLTKTSMDKDDDMSNDQYYYVRFAAFLVEKMISRIK